MVDDDVGGGDSAREERVSGGVSSVKGGEGERNTASELVRFCCWLFLFLFVFVFAAAAAAAEARIVFRVCEGFLCRTSPYG